jgi:hypothetical protein
VIRFTSSIADPNTSGLASSLADYYDDQICVPLVSRLGAHEPKRTC